MRRAPMRQHSLGVSQATATHHRLHQIPPERTLPSLARIRAAAGVLLKSILEFWLVGSMGFAAALLFLSPALAVAVAYLLIAAS